MKTNERKLLGWLAALAVLWVPSALEAEVPPPEGVTCYIVRYSQPGGTPYEMANLTWSNPVGYETIRIARKVEGEEPVDFGVPGDRTFYLDHYAKPLTTRYEIRGVSSSGEESLPVEVAVSEGPRNPFIRGDANRDGTVSISDSATISNWLFKSAGTDGPIVPCLEACDVNDDDQINIGDQVFLLNSLFWRSGPVFPEPFPMAAVDDRPGSLSCVEPEGSAPAMDEEFVIEVGEVEGTAGSIVDVPVFATTPVETDAVSLAFQCDPALVRILGASIEETVLAQIIANHGGSEYEGGDGDPASGEYAYGIVMNLVKDVRIPPLNHAHVLTLQVEILADAPATTTEIVPVNGLGDPPVRNEFSILGDAVYAATYPKLRGALLRIGVPDNMDFFVRSDVNADGLRNISDPICLLNSLFTGGPELSCIDAGDANDDGVLDLSDAVVMLGHLFLGSPEPIPEPSTCGEDASPDTLDCKAFSSCP